MNDEKIESREIFIDNFPCFQEFSVPVEYLKDFGVKDEKIRVYYPLLYNVPLSSYAEYLFTEQGYSKSDSDYYFNMIQVYLALGSIISLKSGKNVYSNQSYILFRNSTLLYSKSFNKGLKNLFTASAIKEELKFLSEKAESDIIEKIKTELKSIQIHGQNDDFVKTLRNAIYDKKSTVELTQKGFENFKLKLLGEMEQFKTIWQTNGRSRNTDEIDKLKKLLTSDFSDEIRTETVQAILKTVDEILSNTKWYESDAGACIFIDPQKTYPEFNEMISDILDKLERELSLFAKSKKPGLNEIVEEWIERIHLYKSNPAVLDQALVWIKNEFSSKKNALKRIFLEGKLYYDRLIGFFCKKSLKLIVEKESLNRYEIRLFLMMNTPQRFTDYHLICRETVFYNYTQFNKTGSALFLLSHIYRVSEQIRLLFINDFIFWLKLFPAWKMLIREDDLLDKKQRRSLESPLESDPGVEDESNEEIDLDTVNESMLMYDFDYEDSDTRLEKELSKDIDALLKKFGKPIHLEIFSHVMQGQKLKTLAQKKGVSEQYISKKFTEMKGIIKKHYKF